MRGENGELLVPVCCYRCSEEWELLGVFSWRLRKSVSRKS